MFTLPEAELKTSMDIDDLVACDNISQLMSQAGGLRDSGHGRVISYSRKVFIPLTQLCRDVCHYCTFAHPPQKDQSAYLTIEQVLDIARRGAEQGCKEALFTLGDKPELRYQAARRELERMGFATTLDYLEHCAGEVLRQTGLLPHINAGVMDEAWLNRLRSVSASQGLMLESTSRRLMERGGAHFGSPDKQPRVRLDMLEAAGRAKIPFTTGLLIGIGETRRERLDALCHIRDLHERYGHIQEIIIQNFRAKPGTKMACAPEPPLDEFLWSIAAARLVLGADMNIQAPPNLSPNALKDLIAAGINDWGGISPVTRDHVNPEAPWPEIDKLSGVTEDAGYALVERLTIYPAYARRPGRWLAPELEASVLRAGDAAGYAREDRWYAGLQTVVPQCPKRDTKRNLRHSGDALDRTLAHIKEGNAPGEAEIVALFESRGSAVARVCSAADQLRRADVGETVTYVVNRNINYTNICSYKCGFCAFSRGRLVETSRDRPYDLSLEEISGRVGDAVARGATEICLQGGIRPGYTGETYLAIVAAVKTAAPDVHIHAFSPLEVRHGAQTLGLPICEFLVRLKAAGLASLPGTAAEILDDEIRDVICPDKLTTEEWLDVMATAHSIGLRSTATIMFGHVDSYHHWVRHLLRIRRLQEDTGGFTEFVPLPFVHMEAPIFLQGRARCGPTFREAILMHAISRLTLSPLIPNIQTSWVKMGPEGAAACLNAGANDLGGVLMNESITRAAGAAHGQEIGVGHMRALVGAIGRVPQQRTTQYDPIVVPELRRLTAEQAGVEINAISNP